MTSALDLGGLDDDRRLASGDDVAAAVRAAIYDLPFTTGAVLSVDGGRPLGTI